MKKLIGWTLALGLCLALLVCGALADEAPAIHVQLDGQELTFTDAVPQVKDQRTFLPFRAVFESMGADVDYEGSVITAVRDGKTLTMTLDQTAATVTQGEAVTPITMDVAPYVDPETWRTYVPVRFAAQAFGCCVGWDQEAQTAIIIDVEKLLAQALEGKSFTYLEKLAALDGKYDQGIWDMTATFDADVSVLTLPMTMTGTVTGTVQDSDKVSMDMGMKLDMSKYMDTIAAMTGMTLDDDDLAMVEALKNDGLDMSVRGDVTAGKLYMNMDMSALGEAADELDSTAWYELDMAALTAQAGMDMKWTALMEQFKSMDYLDLVKVLLASAQPTDAANDYAGVKAAMDTMAATLCDEAFVETDGKRVNTYALNMDDCSVTLGLALDMDGENVTGYTMDLDMTAQVEGQSMKMGMDISMDDQDKMNAKFNMDLAGAMGLEMTMEGAYAPGAAAPVTTPPEGAKVIPLTQLMGGGMSAPVGVGAIGGADGPTAIIAAN